MHGHAVASPSVGVGAAGTAGAACRRARLASASDASSCAMTRALPGDLSVSESDSSRRRLKISGVVPSKLSRVDEPRLGLRVPPGLFGRCRHCTLVATASSSL